MPFEVGQRIGEYEVQKLLGAGGMGRVYKVRHRGWDLALAAKVPRPILLDVEGGAREAAAIRAAGLWTSARTAP